MPQDSSVLKNKQPTQQSAPDDSELSGLLEDVRWGVIDTRSHEKHN